MYRKFDLFKKKTRAIEYPRATPDPAERIEEAELRLAEILGARHAVLFDKSSSALYAAARALELPESSEIIVPAIERIEIPLALELAGLSLNFADVHEITHTLDPAGLPERIGRRTEAILVSTLFGHPAHFAELKEICAAHKIRLIELSLDGLGGIYRGKKNGTHGDVALVGFFYLEGGAIVTDDPRLRERAIRLRNCGVDPVSGEAPAPSLDFRPGHAQTLEILKLLRELDDYLDLRYGIVKEYAKRMERHPHLAFPPTISTATHTYRALVVRVENPALRDALQAKIRGFGFRPRPDAAFLPECERFARLYHHAPKAFPNAMKLSRTGVELPLDVAAGSNIPEELERVITS